MVSSCAVLHDVDPAVGEPAFVAQPHHVELEVLLGSPPAMKCAEIALGGSVSDTVRLRRHEGLRHHLAAERADRVLARVRADERVVVDAG